MDPGNGVRGELASERCVAVGGVGAERRVGHEGLGQGW